MTEPNPPRQASTKDIGLVLSDMLPRNDPYKVYAWEEDDPSCVGEFVIDDIDVSDANNPVVYVTNEDGTCARFRVRIIALGGYE